MNLSLEWIRRRKWFLLLLGIAALLVISPISEVYAQQDNIISPLTAIILLAVAFGTAEKKGTLLCFSVLTSVWFVVSILTEGSGLFARESLVAPLLFMILLAAIFILLARWLIRAAFIDTEVLCAAICGYLLIGIFWAGLYAIIMLNDAKALVSISNSRIELGDMLYFSYTTLTTTGFGDILPKNPVVRMCAVIEAIVGIFYNTIVIARFVSLYGIERPEPRGEASVRQESD